MSLRLWHLQGQHKADTTAFVLPFREVEHTPLLYHHATTQGEADATTASFGSEEWHKERLAVFGRDGQTIVAHIQH